MIRIFTALFTTCCILPVQAQTVKLEFDLNQSPAIGQILNMSNVDGRLYFSANDGYHAYEAWMHDPQTGETRMLGDINDKSGGDQVSRQFVEYAGKIYFSSEDEALGRELYEYNPGDGQVRLVTDLVPGPGDGAPGHFTVYDNKLFFRARTPSTFVRYHLFYYDAAIDSVVQVVPTAPTDPDGPGVQTLIEYDGKLWFGAKSPTGGNGIWTYEAATGQTQPVVYPFGEDGQFIPEKALICGGELFFIANTSTSTVAKRLYRLDKSNANTVVLVSDEKINSIDCLEGHLYFSGTGVFKKYQVSTNGFLPDPDVVPAYIDDYVNEVSNLDGQLFIRARRGGSGSGIYQRKMQGTSEYFELLTALSDSLADNNSMRIAKIGSQVFFEGKKYNTYERELYRYDLNSNQSNLVTDINKGNSGGIHKFPGLVPFDGRIYFSGTSMGADWPSMSNVQPFVFTPGNNPQPHTFYPELTADNITPLPILGAGVFQDRLWISPVVRQGQEYLLGAYKTGTDSLQVYLPKLDLNDKYEVWQFAELNGKWYFILLDLSSNPTGDKPLLWMYDPVLDSMLAIPGLLPKGLDNLHAYGGMLYFTGHDANYTTQFYRIENGQVVLLTPDLKLDNAQVVYEDRIYLQGYRISDGYKGIFTYDPVSGQIKALSQAMANTINLQGAIVFGGKLLLAGTPQNLLFSISPGDDSIRVEIDLAAQNLSTYSSLTAIVFDGRLYGQFNAALYGAELYALDSLSGTAQLIADISPGQGNAYINAFKVIDDKLYFIATDGFRGAEVWSLSNCQIAADLNATPATFGQTNGEIALSTILGTAPYTYVWSNGATTEDLQALSPGFYEVTITDANGCQLSKSIWVDVLVDVFDAPNRKLRLRVFPNPFDQWFRLEAEENDATIYFLQLIDLQGKIILSRTWNSSGAAIFDAGTLPSGLYFLSLREMSGNVVKTVKVMKE